MVNPISFTGITASGNLTVKEVDGNPTVPQVNTIIVSNGTLTNDGGGVVTVTTGGGGGGGVDSWAGGTTGLLPSGATTGVISISGTLVVANGGTGTTTLADDAVLTGTGTAAITAEGNLTFNGTTLTTTGFSCTGNSDIGNAASDTIGFYDISGVVQRTTANATAALHAPGVPTGPIDLSDTFGGYTVSQIVGALQDLGLLDI